MADLLRVLDAAASVATMADAIGWRDGVPVTRGQFLQQVADWRNSLAARPGQSWALYCEDSLHFAAALFGAWVAGKTVLLPGDALPASESALQASAAGFIGDFSAAVQPLQAPDHRAADCRFASLPADAALLEVFTSGSSGEPVAIPKTLRQLAAEVATLESLWGVQLGQAVVRGTVSHQHIYGLLFRVLWPLATGRALDARRLVYTEDIAAAGALGRFALIASPAHLRRLHAGLPWQETRAQLAAVFSSGGPLPPDAAADCEALLGARPIEVYGSSETGGVAYRVRARDGERWQPMPGIQLSAAYDESDEHSADVVRLHIRSPHLPTGETFVSSDRVRLLADGGFVLLGRADRIVKLEEKRVSLSAIESRLISHDWVQEAAVLLLSGERAQLAAVLVLSHAGQAALDSQGRRALADALRSHLAVAFESVALPRRWRYVDAMPVNGQGKLTRQALLALFEDAAPAARARSPQVVVLEKSSERVSQSWYVTPDILYFEGHFAIAPILPGVVQLDWVIEQGRQHFPLAPDVLRIEALKYQHVIQPGNTVRVEMEFRAEAQQLKFAISSEQAVHASGRIVFGGGA